MLCQIRIGTTARHGSFDGTYALKIATRRGAGRAQHGDQAHHLPQGCRIRVESYFAFKPEATDCSSR